MLDLELDSVDQLAAICRKHGVKRVRWGQVELEMADAPTEAQPPAALAAVAKLLNREGDDVSPSAPDDVDEGRYASTPFRPKAVAG